MVTRESHLIIIINTKLYFLLRSLGLEDLCLLWFPGTEVYSGQNQLLEKIIYKIFPCSFIHSYLGHIIQVKISPIFPAVLGHGPLHSRCRSLSVCVGFSRVCPTALSVSRDERWLLESKLCDQTSHSTQRSPSPSIKF